MKKISTLFMLPILAILSSCDFNRPAGPAAESPYTTTQTENFSIEHPKCWFVDSVKTTMRPFAACSPNEQQILIVATILHNDKSVGEFAEERIAAYEEQYRGFNLLEKEVTENTAFLRYETSDAEVGYHQYTIMRIDKHDTHFYGTDCVYESAAEKDTADYILKSMKFK